MKITLTRNDFEEIEKDAIKIGKFIEHNLSEDSNGGFYAKEALLNIVEKTCGKIGLEAVTTALERRNK